MLRRFAVGAARAVVHEYAAEASVGGSRGLVQLPAGRAAAGSFHTRSGGLSRSAASTEEGEKESKNVDYSPDLKGTDFDGPIDLDRAQVRSVGTPRVRKLADEVVNLTLLEVNDLIEILTERLNLPPPTGMPMGGMMMGMGGMPPSPHLPTAVGGAAEEKKEEKTEFDLKLESFDKAAKIKVIKEIRAVSELGLKEAKELVEGAPCIVKKHMSKEDAEAVIEKLKAVGAVVVMV